MKSFSEFINEVTEVHTETMHPRDMKAHIGAGKFNAIIKHPWFRDHFADKDVIGMQYHRTTTGLESVKVAHGPIGTGKTLRRMAEFHIGASGRKIDNVDLYQNWNDEKHNNSLVWRHVKRFKEVE